MSKKPFVYTPISKNTVTPRDLRDRFADVVNVKDFGAKGDGVTDDTSAFEMSASIGKQVFIPDGTYKLHSNVNGQFFSFEDISFVGGLVNGSNFLISIPKKNSSSNTTTDPKFIYRMSIDCELPLKFPDYNAALAICEGESYIWPQGFGIDNDENIYIKYSGKIIVKYDPSHNYRGWHQITGAGESLCVVNDNNHVYLYNRQSDSSLMRFDATNWVGDGSVFSGTTVLDNTSSSGAFLSEDNGTFIVEQAGVDYGDKKSRTFYHLYDSNFTKCGDVFLSKVAVGWQTVNDSEYYPYVPKAQGIALNGTHVITAHGGSYIPATDGNISPRCADIGIGVSSFDGSILSYGVVQADKFINKLNDLGYNYVIRTEVEGISKHPDGFFRMLFVGVRPASSTSGEKGLLILKVADPNGIDFSDIRSSFSPFSIQRYINGVFPRMSGSGMYNPLTGEKIESILDLIHMMSAMQIPRTSWYSSAVTIAGIGDMEIPQTSLVTLYNCNNIAFFASVCSSSATGINNTYLLYRDSNGNYHSSKTLPFDQSSKYKGKRLSILGDSISTFRGYIPEGNATYYPNSSAGVSNVNETWWYKLYTALDMILDTNNSWSGSRVTIATDASSTSIASSGITRCTNLGNPDVIIIYLGINDFANNIPLGSYDGSDILPDENVAANKASFREGYSIMLSKLLATYPTTEIWCATLPQYNRGSSDVFPTNNNIGSLELYNKAIRELANAFGIKTLDLANCGLTFWNREHFGSLHPNPFGHSLMANYIISVLDSSVKKQYDIQ